MYDICQKPETWEKVDKKYVLEVVSTIVTTPHLVSHLVMIDKLILDVAELTKCIM